MCFRDQVKIVMWSRSVTFALLMLASACVLLLAFPAKVNAEAVAEVIMSDGQMQTFGGYRDGTYTAFIAIFSISIAFLQFIYREHAMIRGERERTEQAKLHAAGLHGLSQSLQAIESRMIEAGMLSQKERDE